MSEKLTILPKRWTTSDLIKLIPQNWRNVEVCIGNTVGDAKIVRRISLHTNNTGKRVILLHQEEIESPKS